MARPRALLALACVVLGVASAAAQQKSFYDMLKADPSHRLIMKAIDADKQGTMKQMLQKEMPVTALVPTDAAFVRAGMKYKMGRGPADMTKVMGNTCLINSILKQHIIPGVYTTEQLAKFASRPSMLVTPQLNGSGAKVNWPLRFAKSGSDLTVGSAAVVGGAGARVAAINGTVTSPSNVAAGGGMLHNINTLMLPTTDMVLLMKITGCPVM